MSRTGTKRKRREAETDVLFDGTDFIWSLPIHGKQDNQDNPVNTGKIIIIVNYNHNEQRKLHSSCSTIRTVHIIHDNIIIITIHNALYDYSA